MAEGSSDDSMYSRRYARLSLFEDYEDDELETGNGLPPRPIKNIPPEDEPGMGYEVPHSPIRNISTKDIVPEIRTSTRAHDIPPEKESIPEIRTTTTPSHIQPFILTVDGFIKTPRARGRRDSPRKISKSPPRTKPNSTVPIIPSPLTTFSFPPPSIKKKVIRSEGAKRVPELENFETQAQHEEPGPPKKMGLEADSSLVAAQNPPRDGETVKSPPMMASAATQCVDETPNYCGTCEMRKELKEIKSMLMSLVVRMSNLGEKLGS